MRSAPPSCCPVAQSKPSASAVEPSSGSCGRRERLGLGGLDADDIEPSDSVEFRPVVVSSECHLGVDDDAFGKGSLQLLQARDAELAEVALCHRQGGFA